MYDFPLPAWIDPDLVIPVAAAMTALLVVYVVWQLLVTADPIQNRLKALTDRGLRTHVRRDPGQRRQKLLTEGGFAGQFLKRLNLLRSREAERVSLKLARAGFRSRDAFVAYQFMRLIMPFAMAGLGVIGVVWLQLLPLPQDLHGIAAMGLAVLGWMLPDIYLKNRAQKRQELIRKAFPDALDLLVICAEAGLSLDAALSRVARELGNAAPELADEFGLTAIELNFMPDRQQAMTNLVERTGLPAVRGMVGTMRQSERYGTPLAQSLRVLAAEMRDERMMRAEEKAARLPAILTVPMIIFILPPLFIVLLGPAILRVMDAMAN